MKRVNAAVIGCGFIAETAHIPNLRTIPKAKLVAMCDVDKERLNAMGSKFNVTKLCLDFREVVEDPEIDVVIVCTPPSTHAEIAEAAVKKRKTCFCREATLHGLCPR